MADSGGQLTPAAQVAAVSAGDWTASGGRSGALVLRTRHANTLADRVTISSQGAVRFHSIGATAVAANATLDAGDGNSLLRSTSSRRYKRAVEHLDPDRAEAVLDLRPVWYRSTAPADRPDRSWYGLIAEEVAEIEPRLVHWAYTETEYATLETADPETGETRTERALKPGAERVPDGVQYDRLAVLLIDVVRRQRDVSRQSRPASRSSRRRLRAERARGERQAARTSPLTRALRVMDRLES